MPEGSAELRIRFASMEKLLNYIRLLREEKPTQIQPFGEDVNAVVYIPGEDDTEIAPENDVILVAGHREDLAPQFLLGPPGEEPAPEPPAPPQRPRGVPDQLFAPHGGPGGTRPDDGRTRGLNEPAPY
jgi:hypothetical protein